MNCISALSTLLIDVSSQFSWLPSEDQRGKHVDQARHCSQGSAARAIGPSS